MSGPLRFRDAAGVAIRKLSVWTAATEAAISTSPTVTSGSGAPTATEPNGSLYLRTNGTALSTIYARVSGAWTTPSPVSFLSTEQTGNGSAQSVAHGLGSTPSLAYVIPSNLTGGPFVVTYGTHTSTNVVVTVTNGEKYMVVAFK